MTGVQCELTEKELDVLTALKTAGVFELTNGQAILNFNPFGVLTDVDIHVKAFTRKQWAVVKKTVTMKTTQLL
jgi:hypothetical protein